MRKPIIILLALVLALASCNRRSHLLYMKNLGHKEIIALTPVPVYRLKPGDVLYIQLITSNPEVSQAFNNPTGSTDQSRGEASLYLNGYTVQETGDVSLPYIGNVEVIGKPIGEARQAIIQSTRQAFRDASVVVKLASFKVTVVGEVRRPGVIRNFNDHLNIFEALANAGDMTENALRENVLVLRTTDEERITHRLDLSDKSILTSEAFYIMPNDIIIVEPKENKVFQMNMPYISLIFSTISTTLLLINFFAN
jgi:polysaccharide biosynthesis/export protein